MEEEENHTRLKTQEEACIDEEARMKYEEEEEYLRLKTEEEARITEKERLKLEYHECAHLKVEDCGISRTESYWKI